MELAARKTFKRTMFQPTVSDPEDWEMEQMVNRTRITTAAKFHNRDEKEGWTVIGTETEPPAEKTHIVG